MNARDLLLQKNQETEAGNQFGLSTQKSDRSQLSQMADSTKGGAGDQDKDAILSYNVDL